MKDADLDIYINKPKGIAHNKTIVIDDSIVVTGSYNFTKAAEYYNVENIIIINSKEFNKVYRENFYKCLKYSKNT